MDQLWCAQCILDNYSVKKAVTISRGIAVCIPCLFIQNGHDPHNFTAKRFIEEMEAEIVKVSGA